MSQLYDRRDDARYDGPAGARYDEPYDEPDDAPYDEPDDTRYDEPNTDPGAPLDSQGIPDYADDASPERQDLPEPQRFPTPTEAPTASTDFGTTAAEQRTGESLEQKLSREAPDDGPAGASEVGPGEERGAASDVEPGEQPGETTASPRAPEPAEEHSPYEREIPPADSDLAVHETLPGEIR